MANGKVGGKQGWWNTTMPGGKKMANRLLKNRYSNGKLQRRSTANRDEGVNTMEKRGCL